MEVVRFERFYLECCVANKQCSYYLRILSILPLFFINSIAQESEQSTIQIPAVDVLTHCPALLQIEITKMTILYVTSSLQEMSLEVGGCL